ncbi:hypothetical protein AWV80_18635 [Cupriavidus sp. UYMU48A]|nr:hypothetical protein AWV80_18635 [Cupriavidus sp. UYMU48A]
MPAWLMRGILPLERGAGADANGHQRFTRDAARRIHVVVMPDPCHLLRISCRQWDRGGRRSCTVSRTKNCQTQEDQRRPAGQQNARPFQGASPARGHGGGSGMRQILFGRNLGERPRFVGGSRVRTW